MDTILPDNGAEGKGVPCDGQISCLTHFFGTAKNEVWEYIYGIDSGLKTGGERHSMSPYFFYTL